MTRSDNKQNSLAGDSSSLEYFHCIENAQMSRFHRNQVSQIPTEPSV